VNRRGLVVLVLVFAALPAAAQSRGEKYAPTDGRFAVRFPGKPREMVQTTPSALGDIKVVSATYATSDGNAYLVSYTDFPEGAARTDASETLFDGLARGLTGKDGKIVDEKKGLEVGPEKSPGREIEVEKDKKRMKFRVVLRDGRLYQAAVIGSPSFVKGKDATAFLESFELTK
jgi:hypothetical protein